MLQNISQKTTIKNIDLPLAKPDFPYLDLITNSTTYKLLKVKENEYAVTQHLPYAVKGYIKAPKVGQNGNEMIFGWVNNEIQWGVVMPKYLSHILPPPLIQFNSIRSPTKPLHLSLLMLSQWNNF